MKNVLIIILCNLLISCQDSGNNLSATAINLGVEIAVKSEEGLDLLNPDNANSFDVNNIKLFYMQNNQKIEHPRNLHLYE